MIIRELIQSSAVGAWEIICPPSCLSCCHTSQRSCTLPHSQCFPPAPPGPPALGLYRFHRNAPCGIRCNGTCQWGGPLLPSSLLSAVQREDKESDTRGSTLPPTDDRGAVEPWIMLGASSPVWVWLRWLHAGVSGFVSATLKQSVRPHRHADVGRLFALHQAEDGHQSFFLTLTFEPLQGQRLQSSLEVLEAEDPGRLLSDTQRQDRRDAACV